MGIKHPLFWPFWYLHCKIKIKCLLNCKRILFRSVADSKYNENTTLVGKCLSTSATWPDSTRVFSQRQWRQRRETLGTRLPECSNSSLSTLAGLSYHICGKLEGAFKGSPSSQHQHCTDEAQKAETVLSAVMYIHIYISVFKNVSISKHVYHIYNYTFSAPVSFLWASENTCFFF